ncbi:super-infection exclusion protein B [Ornithinibacillus sp. 179-J 7C1 HS]|uniref:super-infection exclusion protein B n=1 Tax=Ornithinibacillus sp. 179-J 7C1 HS TaxID=3142384 RepID=UPI0039A11FE5
MANVNGKDFTEILKLSPKYLLGIVIFSGGLSLIGNSDLASPLGIEELYNSYNTWITIILIISSSLLLGHLIWHLGLIIKGKFQDRSLDKFRKKRLKDLTPEEKAILSFYIIKNTRSQKLNYTNGAVRELEYWKIIYRSSELGNMRSGFSYNIQPWAWEYLKKNPHLVETPIDHILL